MKVVTIAPTYDPHAMGEDIRHAKAIYENRFGFQVGATPRTWLSFANEVRNYLELKTLQETTKHLNINV